MEKRRFRFLKKLSEGTFGKVYLAEIITDSKFSKVVAIKLLHAKWADHDEIIKRSRDEARVLGRLQHRNIIKVEGLISIGGKCAIIMEYLNGVDLKTLINFCAKNRIRIPRKVIFETISSVASALDAAYNRPPLQGGDPLRLIHRDIKPSNIMVTVEADVKVLDFGTAQAKFEDREAETQALAFGSAAYMSPERFLGDEDRLSGDVYALGVTLYELLYQGRYGKANVRQEKYYEEQGRRLEKLDLEDVSDELAARIHKLLEGMLRWEESERPSLAHILQETEEIAQEVNDGSLKLFCRNTVEKCKETLTNPNAQPDALENQVLFEDGSESFSDPLPEMDPDIQSSISFPPPIPVAQVTPPPPSAEPTVDLELTKPELEDTLKVQSDAVQKAKSARAEQAVNASKAVVGAGAQSNTSTSTKSKAPTSSKSAMPMILGGGLLLLLLGGGVGYWFISQSSNGTSETSSENGTQTDEGATKPSIPKGDPGTAKDLGADTGTRVVLTAPDNQDILISLKQKSFEYDWNGEGQIELTNVPAGKLRATISRTGTPDERSQIFIQKGKDCTYTLQTESELGWSESCSGE